MQVGDLFDFDVQCHCHEFARIDHIRGMAGNGYRMIHQLKLPDSTFLLIFRSFSRTKEMERPIILRERNIIEIREKLGFIALLMQEFYE